MRHNALQTVNTLSALLAALFALQLCLVYGTPNGWLRDDAGRPVAKDFVNFYSAGRLVSDGKPSAPYDWSAHREAQNAVIGPHNTQFFPWPYPPVFLPVAEVLASAPYSASYLAFGVVTFALAGFALVRITRTRWSLLWVAAFSGTLWNVYAGQNGLLSAALLGLGLVSLSSRPVLSGVAFGLLAYKPQLGLLIPLALAAGGYWRVFTAAAATVIATVTLSVLLYGFEPWVAFVDQLGRIGNTGLVEAYGKAYKFQSVFGLMRALGADPALAMPIHVVAALGVAALTVFVWRSALSLDLKSATLSLAVLATSPYVFIYDMAILAVASAFLIRHLSESDANNKHWQDLVIALFAANLLVYAFPFMTFPSGLLAVALLGGMIWSHASSGTFPSRAPMAETPL